MTICCSTRRVFPPKRAGKGRIISALSVGTDGAVAVICDDTADPAGVKIGALYSDAGLVHELGGVHVRKAASYRVHAGAHDRKFCIADVYGSLRADFQFSVRSAVTLGDVFYRLAVQRPKAFYIHSR